MATTTPLAKSTHAGSHGTGQRDAVTPASIGAAAAADGITAAERLKLTQVSGTNTGDQTAVAGNAGTATKLAVARTINGVAFDGTGNVTVADATKAPLASPTFTGTVAGVTAAMVGLGNVSNTSDTAKPVSTATAAAITAAVATTYAVINYATSTSSWPLRATVTTDTTRPVRWRGPAGSPPPTSTGYAIAGLDEFAVTS